MEVTARGGRSDSNTDELVSVLVPVYNKAEYLAECLSSIIEQSYEALEIIVVEDKSTDGSRDIVADFAVRDSRINVVSNPQSIGMLSCRRRCLEMATGTYIKYVLPDDRLHRSAVENLVKAILLDERLVMATSSRSAIGPASEIAVPIRSMSPVSPTDMIFDGRAFGNLALKLGINVVGELTAVLFRRDSIRIDDAFRIGDRYFHAVGDLALWLRILATGSVLYVTEPQCDVRIVDGRISAQGISGLRGHLEWLYLINEAKRIGYLGDEATAHGALSSAAIQTMGYCINSVNLVENGVVGAILALAREVEDLQRAFSNALISIVVIPSCQMSEDFLERVSKLVRYKFELVSVEEMGSRPNFNLSGAMLPLSVEEVPAGCSDALAWNSGFRASSGPYLLFASGIEDMQVGQIEAALIAMDADPLLGIVILFGSSAQELVGVIVRSIAFSEVGGFDEPPNEDGSVDSGIGGRTALIRRLMDKIIAAGYEELRIEGVGG
ncbi:MAG TPA: glycosyltransferase [Acidimicrobiales bacterium]|nr:glycosyltransferase [Acidimicrobiales bacterium]